MSRAQRRCPVGLASLKQFAEAVGPERQRQIAKVAKSGDQRRAGEPFPFGE
ncbi:MULTISPECIES: hypothetical protein [unclassified Streptomyces]|uniref:hypothetical protein n=1 Tax=unclassified Streptomyces TaxID=2593676 RepID=UPI001BEC1FD7|nr:MULTISPECIES: hypothetical protein [unclassified Streptomyces]MBT2407552.1 hypothetical protein [Streptomyces sp. ISL-21]MBT2608108.1 hypothetical protein [Streptomyces sp. ISL-87]